MNRTGTIASAITAGLLLGWGGAQLHYANKILPGVSVNGLDLSGLNKEQATRKIQLEAESFGAPTIEVVSGKSKFSLNTKKLGWSPNIEATADAALRQGKGNPFALLSSFRSKKDINVIPSLNAEKVHTVLGQIKKSLDRTPTDSKVIFYQGKYIAVSEKIGRSVEIENAEATLLEHPDSTRIEFAETATSPNILKASLETAVAQANGLLRPFTLTYPLPGTQKSRTIQLSSNEVRSLLRVGNSVEADEKAVKTVMARAAYNNDVYPINARYVLGSGNKLVIRPHQDGWKLNQDKAAADLSQGILSPGATTLELPIYPKPAQIRKESLPVADKLVLIAQATTTFAGSSYERVANVRAAANNLDGYVVPSGGEFNFNNAIGNISLENGFKEALVISNGRTVKGVGGGVCQVSTTTFRALYTAGLPIVERNQHAYRVHWYDPIIGFDAAVYQPSVNMRMTNDTPGPLLVRTIPRATSLTVQVFGISDGRKVSISRPDVSGFVAHPPTRYALNTSLKTGQIKQVDWAADGYTTRLYRTIRTASGQVKTHTLASRYQPWQAVYEYGPGTRIGATASR